MTALDDAIARARRQIARDEAPIRRSLHRAYRDALDNIIRDLESVTARLDGIPLPDSWFDARGRFTPLGEELFRQQRLRLLLPQVEAEMRRFSDRGIRIIADGQRAAVSGGAHAAAELTTAAGATSVAGFGVGINRPAAERLISAWQPGSPLRDVLDAYGDQAVRIIERELAAGIIEGKSPREVVKAVRETLGGGTNRARLEALTRTEYLRAFRGSLADQMQAIKQPGDRWRWVAAKSSRTCLSCLSMDGRLLTEQPTQFHISCRCIFHLVPAGSTIPYESGPDWFARQPEATQRAMLPSGDAFAAYQRGDVTLDDFRGVRRSRTWGTAYVERSGRQAMAHAKGRAVG